MIRHMILMLALVAVFAAAGCATNRNRQGWTSAAPADSGSGGSCPSCH